MDTFQTPETDQVGNKTSTKMIVALVIVGVLSIAGTVIGSMFVSDKIDALGGRIKVLETATAAKPATDADPATPVLVAQAAAPVVAVPVSSAKVEPLPPPVPAGEYAVQLHVLYQPRQIAIEERETASAFEDCGKDIALTFCVAKVNGQKKKMAALAKSANGMTMEEANQVAVCFNNSMAIDGQDNAAEPALLKELASDCEAATE